MSTNYGTKTYGIKTSNASVGVPGHPLSGLPLSGLPLSGLPLSGLPLNVSMSNHTHGSVIQSMIQLGAYDETAPSDWTNWEPHPAVANWVVCLKCGAMVDRHHKWITLHEAHHASQTYIMDEPW